jgi:hypothetical protein
MAMVSLRVNIIANGYKYLHVAPNSHQVAHMRARTLSKVAERAWGGEVANPLLELRAAIVPAPTATFKSIDPDAFMDPAASDYVLAVRVRHAGSIVMAHAVGT